MLPLEDIKLRAGQMNQMIQALRLISEIKPCCHTPSSDSCVSMMAPSSLSKKLVMTQMTDQELDSVTIVFHQFETGLREGTIYTKVRRGRPLSFMLSHAELKILNVIRWRNQDSQTYICFIFIFCKNETWSELYFHKLSSYFADNKTPSLEAFSEYPCVYQLWQNCLI